MTPSHSTARYPVQDDLRDSARWDAVEPRDGDIVIATCYKSGTTLIQQIVNLLINGGRAFGAMRELSPWVESRRHGPPAEAINALPSPRFLKTHLEPAALPWLEQWRYIYCARDPRDVCVSLYSHIRGMREARLAAGGNDEPPLPDFGAFWDRWVETGAPRWDYWQHVDRWWRVRDQPNVLLLHYNDLTARKAETAARIAAFVGCRWDPAVRELVLRDSSIEAMRDMELAGRFGGAGADKTRTTLVHKGTNGRWRALLSADQLARHGEIVAERLDPDCAAWLHPGGVAS